MSLWLNSDNNSPVEGKKSQWNKSHTHILCWPTRQETSFCTCEPPHAGHIQDELTVLLHLLNFSNLTGMPSVQKLLLLFQIHSIFIISETKVDRLSVINVWNARNGFTDRTGTHIAKVSHVPLLLKARFREERDTAMSFITHVSSSFPLCCVSVP